MFVINGYLMTWSPHSNNADTYGKVYVHRAVMAHALGRRLLTTENVHHIDGDRANNTLENLMLVAHTEHPTLHAKPKMPQPCLVCGRNTINKKYCDTNCAGFDRRIVDRPDVATLKHEISEMPWVAIGRKYGVSDNAVRKWARSYNLV